MMDPTPAEPPPGCLVLLLRLSAGMVGDVVTPRGETPAFVAARVLADDLVEGLVNTVAGGYAVGAIDVAVLGYRAGADGAPELLSLLPDGDPEPRFVPLARVAEMPAGSRGGEGQPRKWAVPPACGGEPCPTAALASVYQMVSVWLTGRYSSRPPVVVHCTGGAALDDAYLRVARSLGLLATGHGPARLLHYVFDAAPEGDLLERLAAVSAELPEGADPGKPARRAAFANDWDVGDLWDALFSYAWRDEPVAWAGADAAYAPVCSMWAPKMGNTPEQWEDAFALDEAGGGAAVADGASSGIYCSIWAQQLSRRFLSDRPDARDPGALNAWVNGLRTEWRAAINYGNLNWSKQAKVDQVGAAATLLGLELGPADATGRRPWRACAVGDASLFWVRGGELLATFPVVAADQFGSAPLLIRSNPGFRTVAVAASGGCEPGDRFVLATDAVAVWLFKSAASGPGPDWARVEALAEDEWRAEMDTLRKANDMVNDDCTLVVLRVTGGEHTGRGQEGDREELRLHAGRHPHTAEPPVRAHDSPESEGVAAAGDLMTDPPAPERDTPSNSPQATKDGFPESTDRNV